MPPTLSINLCCYNSEKYLRETLDSIVNQTYKDWELVIINDGSSDCTEVIINEYINQGYPIIYHCQENQGLGYSRNKAIELSKGEYIAIIDHDDIWLPSKLKKQMSLFKNRPEIGLVYSEGIIFFPNGVNELYSHFSNHRYYRGYVLDKLFFNDFVICSSIVVKRSVIDHVGWFDPSFNHVEEYDLLLRISEKYSFDYLDEPLVQYRIHESNASRNISHTQIELVRLIKNVLLRWPFLLKQIDSNILRMRMRGLLCDPGYVHLFDFNWASAISFYGSYKAILRILPRVFLLYFISGFSVAQIIRLKRLLGHLNGIFHHVSNPRHRVGTSS